MILLNSFFVILSLFLVSLFLFSGKKYKECVKEYGKAFQFSFMAPSSLYIIDRFRIMEHFSHRVSLIHQKMISIHGSKISYNYTRLFLAQIISAVLFICWVSTLLAGINQDLLFFYYGMGLSLLVPLLLLRELDKQLQKKRDEITLELPEFLNKITLLVNAGETVQKAIIRVVEQTKNPEKSYLYKELLQSVHELKNNVPFHQVLESLNKRCGTQEVSLFTTTVLLNFRRGSGEFVAALRMLTKELWEKRKAMTRTLGEQASSKLVFPMVLIFLVVLLIIAAPAFMLF